MNTKRSIRRAAAAVLLCGLLPLLPDAADGQWPRHFENPSATWPVEIAVDPNDGDVFLAGVFSGTVDFDLDTGVQATARGATDVYVVKYDQLGAFQWLKTAESKNTGESLTIGGLALDDTGNVFVAGTFQHGGAIFGRHTVEEDVDGDSNAYLAKLNDDGDSGEWDFAASAESVPNCGFYASSSVTGLAISGRDVYVSATMGKTCIANKDAGTIWRFSMDPGSGAGENVYLVLGTTVSAIGAGEDRIFFAGGITLFDPVINYAKRLNFRDGESEVVWSQFVGTLYSSIAVDSLGDPHFAGGGAVQKLNGSTGELVWTLPGESTAGVNALTLDADDNVYFAAAPVRVVKYDRVNATSVELGWEAAASTTTALGASIAVRDEDVYVGGWGFGTVPFSDASTSTLANFVASLDAVGGNSSQQNRWTAGEEIPAPLQGLPDPPVRPIPEIPNVFDPESYFYWDETTHRYYAVRQVAGAIVRWPTGPEPDAATIRTNGSVEWPSDPDPQLHVPGAAVYLQPEGLNATFQELQFAESEDATVDFGNVFRSSDPGFSVLRYEEVGGGTRFEVARTVPVEDLTLEPSDSLATCVVGTPLATVLESSPDFHDDPGGGRVHVVPPAPIDAVGPDRAYDPMTRRGPILPVNVTDGMVVVGYRPSPLGIGWPHAQSSIACTWPDVSERIVLDELVGSEHGGQLPLDPQSFSSARIYVQNDPALLGFNPNEEHAFLAPSNPDPPRRCDGGQPAAGSGFQAAFALRRQSDTSASEPFVLLKHRDPVGGEWRIRIYEVVASTGAPADEFCFDVEVGTLVPRPHPLSQIPGCRDTNSDDTPFWLDKDGNVYARSNGEMNVEYFYPLLPSFSGDGVGESGASPGDCVRWLEGDRRVLYRASWPDDVPVLLVGETLITAREDSSGSEPARFLPEIFRQAAVEVIFQGDLTEPESVESANPVHLVKPLDALSTRWVEVDDSDPGLFRRLIEEAPFPLQVRLEYDPLLSRLGFRGYLDDSGLGAPLLLLNVLSERELNRLRALPSCLGQAACQEALDALYDRTRDPEELSPSPEELTIGLRRTEGGGREALRLGEGGVLSAGAARGTGYVTVAFNNEPGVTAPVTLRVIRVECGPHQGSIRVLPAADVFEPRLSLRHSGDFGGEPERFTFDWYRRMAPYDRDDDGVPPGDPWEPLFAAPGAVDVTILPPGAVSPDEPAPGNPAELILPDNYYFVSYVDERGTCGAASPFAGDPAGTPAAPVAQLAEGWIKRVIRGLNPFQARSSAFHDAPVNTFASLLVQAGEPFDGPVAWNGDPANLNSIGLIEAYETVLRRGLALTGQADDPAITDGTATALLLAAARIADLYVLLGNEASSDAVDPTIGFVTASDAYGTLAPSIFAFQNQLPSLLAEELALLRGRDGRGAAVNLHPVFNRLLWNFTSGDGELAYALVYDVSDQDGDGRIDDADARVQFPQGHGDAWGHYLTAQKSFYRLLREPRYVWRTRGEQVAVAGTAVTVDYADERRLARAAAARAKAGAQILDLTYRQEYVEDPAGQWQGYKDSDPERAWGVDGWGRRAGQGAYFDWVVANALLPDEWEAGDRGCDMEELGDDFLEAECPSDPVDPATGRIDRTTVPELREITCHYEEVQTRLDEADLGLNPLGLAKGVVPFDVDPVAVDAGLTHFEQVADRAERALLNAVAVFDHANGLSESLRRNQDTLEDFRQNVDERERDFLNRLIEIFGLPYPEDVGPGGTYPSGYDGPDVYHFMFVDPTELTGAANSPTEVVEAFFSPLPNIGFFPGADADNPIDPDARITVRYEMEPQRAGLVAPVSWSERPAPGEVQRTLSSYYQGLASYEQALQEYDNLLEEIEDGRDILKTIRGANAAQIEILNDQLGTVRPLDAAILAARTAQHFFRRAGLFSRFFAGALAEALPTVIGVSTDATSVARGAIQAVGIVLGNKLEIVANIFDTAELGVQLAKEEVGLTTAIRLIDPSEVPSVEAERQLRFLEQLLRREPVLRLEAFNRREALQQTLGTYRAAVARGLRLLDELASFRAQTAADVQEYRYQDVAFRLTRNDALQKYRAQFDLASRYAYLAATAYDYETNLLGSASGAGRDFLTDVVRHRSLGEVVGGEPVAGSRGLADPLARLRQNFAVLEGQLGFNNPQTETTPFSVRKELLRLRNPSENAWRQELEKYRVANLWDLPEFRRYARPFAPEPPPGETEPGLVIGFEGNGGQPFQTTVSAGLNFFGWPLGSDDSTYDATHFATRIRSVGVWLDNYEKSGLSATPRVYLIPVGADVLRPPTAGDFSTREWQVVDQVLPVPFPIGATDLADPEWIPLHDGLAGELGGVRRFSRFRAYADPGGFDPAQTTTDSRLIGRSVWNTRWLLIIPGETLLADKEEGIDTFIKWVRDIRIFFQTYAYSGN